MKYVKKLLSLPESVGKRLDEEHNSSRTVVEALKLYWELEDSSREVINRNEQILELLNDSDIVALTEAIPEIPETPIVMERACCLARKPCQHWVYDGAEETWTNSISGRSKEV